MGLFSSKKEVEVSVSVTRVVENHLIKNTMLDSAVKAILYSHDIPKTNAGNLMNSIGAKTNVAYLWAENNYHWGLPQSRIDPDTSTNPALAAVFNTLYGVGHTVSYYTYGDINPTHYAWRTLVASYAYNPATNRLGTLTTSKGTPVYLKNIVPVITQASYDYALANDVLYLYDVMGPPPNSGITVTNPTGNPGAVVIPYEVDPLAVTDSIRVEYEYLNGVPITEVFTLTIPAANEGRETHQARVIGSNGVINYFSYIIGTGTYPTLDSIDAFNTDEAGTFLPWVYFRYDFRNEACSAEAAAAYDTAADTTRAFMKSFAAKGNATVPADVDQYKDAVKYCKYFNLDFASICKAINSNPEVGDVAQASLNFSVDLNATAAVEREYLFKYFSALFTTMSGGSEYGSVTQEYNRGVSSQLIRDKRTQTRFSFEGISRTLVTGVVAQVGKYYTFSRGSYAKQISATQYIRVTMAKPKMSYLVTGDGEAKWYTAGGDNKALRIPVDRSILRLMGIVQKEELLARAMVIIFCTLVVIETKWYQQEWFKIVLIIVAVIITLLSIVFPPLTGLALVLWTIIFLVVYFIIMYVVMMVIQKAIEILIDALGLENTFFAIAIMVVVACVAIYMGDGETATSMLSQITGAMLTAMPTMLSSSYQAAVADEMKELQDEMRDFSKIAEKQQEEMQAKREEYGNNRNLIDGLEFVKKSPQVIWGESPEFFYQRSVHNVNMSNVPYEAITNYVKVALTPPDIKMTLAKFNPPKPLEA